MCLAVPARITSIDGMRGMIDLEGVRREISLLLCPDAAVGQYALVHAGFAITILDEEEAQSSLAVFDEYRRLMESDAGPGAVPDDFQDDPATRAAGQAG